MESSTQFQVPDLMLRSWVYTRNFLRSRNSKINGERQFKMKNKSQGKGNTGLPKHAKTSSPVLNDCLSVDNNKASK